MAQGRKVPAFPPPSAAPFIVRTRRGSSCEQGLYAANFATSSDSSHDFRSHHSLCQVHSTDRQSSRFKHAEVQVRFRTLSRAADVAQDSVGGDGLTRCDARLLLLVGVKGLVVGVMEQLDVVTVARVITGCRNCPRKGCVDFRTLRTGHI